MKNKLFSKFIIFFNAKKIAYLSLIFFILDRLFKILSTKGVLPFYPNHKLSMSLNLPINFQNYFYIFLVIIILILIYLTIYYYLNKNIFKFNSFFLVGLGAISNFYDRIKFGFVVDYFNFYFFYNNLADILIILGLILLLLKTRNKPNKFV
jgi:lipoprotein signal peptidase